MEAIRAEGLVTRYAGKAALVGGPRRLLVAQRDMTR